MPRRPADPSAFPAEILRSPSYNSEDFSTNTATDPKIDESLSISKTKDSKTKDSDSSFKTPVRFRQSKPKKCLSKTCFPATNVATSFSMSPLNAKLQQLAMNTPVIKKCADQIQ